MELLLYILFCVALCCLTVATFFSLDHELHNRAHFSAIYIFSSVIWMILIYPKLYIVFLVVYGIGFVYALIKLYIMVRIDNTVVISQYRVFTWMMTSPILLPIDLFKCIVWLTAELAKKV